MVRNDSDINIRIKKKYIFFSDIRLRLLNFMWAIVFNFIYQNIGRIFLYQDLIPFLIKILNDKDNKRSNKDNKKSDKDNKRSDKDKYFEFIEK